MTVDSTSPLAPDPYPVDFWPRWRAWVAQSFPPALHDVAFAAVERTFRSGGDPDTAMAAAASAAREAHAAVATSTPPDTGDPEGGAPLVGETAHEHGSVGISADGGRFVIRTHGKNVLTRREWRKEDGFSMGVLSRILVESRDRKSFTVSYFGSGGRLASTENIAGKDAVDVLLREIAARAPHAVIELAHPSHGLPDPAHERAKRERLEATRFNDDEQRRRRAAAATPEVKVKTYDNAKDYERDAKAMGRAGWMPQGEVAGRGKVSAGGTVGKLVLTGGLGAVTGFSRKGNKITVTWVKQPPTHEPREFRPIPEVPTPRVFPPEPYFEATLTAVVLAGNEYPPIAPMGLPPAPEPALVASPLAPADPSPDRPAEQPRSASIADRLRSLAELRDAGLITDDEFQAKRTDLLNQV